MKPALELATGWFDFLYLDGLDKGFEGLKNSIRINHLSQCSLSKLRVFQPFVLGASLKGATSSSFACKVARGNTSGR